MNTVSHLRRSFGALTRNYQVLASSVTLRQHAFIGSLLIKSERFYSSTNNGIIIDKKDRVLTLTLNRPERYNAINIPMYFDITKILNTAATDDDISIVKFTGAGHYYCSGNDLKDVVALPPSDMAQAVRDAGPMLKNFVSAFIDFPKILVAAVNGPAVGISVTTLALFDAIYAIENATFHTPFAKTGQSPEGCASYTFPKLMGHAQATNLLSFGHVMTAQEALGSIVTKIFSASTFEEDVDSEIRNMLSLSNNSVVHTKQLMRDHERELLHVVNEKECDLLLERWTSVDFMKAVMKFAGKSS